MTTMGICVIYGGLWLLIAFAILLWTLRELAKSGGIQVVFTISKPQDTHESQLDAYIEGTDPLHRSVPGFGPSQPRRDD